MQIFRGLPQNSKPVALTVGNFDGVHLGHQALLEQLCAAAKVRGLQTAVVIFEPHPREFFNPATAPARLTRLREKLQFFAQMNIDQVYVCRFNARFAQMTAVDFIKALHEKLTAQFILIGDDFRFGNARAGDFALLEKIAAVQGFSLQAMHSVRHDGIRISSTAIRAALGAGQLASAQRYLGRHYSMSGRVVHGDKIGRTLGFPTANLQVRHTPLPLSGIYVVQVHGAGLGVLQGVASLGIRPTVKHNAQPVLEVHLFEFDQQIYGKQLRVEFLQKLRDEAKYPDLATLIKHIALDVQHAKEWFEQRD